MTSKEKLSYLVDRPCSACSLHGEDGCSIWSCVFEKPAENKKCQQDTYRDSDRCESMSTITELEYELIEESNKAEREAEEESRFGVIEEADKTEYYRLGLQKALKILRGIRAKYETQEGNQEGPQEGTQEGTSKAAGVRVAPVQQEGEE